MNSAEVWRPIEGFERYQVSNLGNVYSAVCGRNLKASPNRLGRRLVGLHADGTQVGRLVASLVCEAFVGPRLPGMTVSHLDGNRTNDRADNLAWETMSENLARRAEHGTLLLGEKAPFAKLSEADVLEIRRLLSTGEYAGLGKHSALAARFGVTRANIYMIAKRRSWRWLEAPSGTN